MDGWKRIIYIRKMVCVTLGGLFGYGHMEDVALGADSSSMCVILDFIVSQVTDLLRARYVRRKMLYAC